MADTNLTGLNSLIAQYGTDSAKVKAGVATDSTPKTSSSDSLADQNVFMELYIAQLKNQDPTSPQETGDMVAQMADFSSLEKLTEMTDGIKSMSESLISSQALTASTLVGNKVYVDSESITLDGSNSANIKAALPDDTKSNEVKIYDSSNQLVKTTSFDSSGRLEWDGKDASGEQLAAGDYKITATSTNASGEVTQLATLVASRINGVTLNGADGTTLNVAGHGSVKLTDNLEVIG